MHAMRKPLTLLPAALAVVALALTACSGDDSSTAVDAARRPSPTTSCDYPADPAGAAKEVEPPPADAPDTGDVDVTIGTTVGDLKATLGRDKTPCTVNSFVSLAEQGYFDDVACHRMTTAGIFVLQCGDPSGSGAGGPGYSFADELDGHRDLRAGHAGDGQRRPGHQRQPVLHRVRRLAAAGGLHRVRAPSTTTPWRRSRRWPRRAPTTPTARATATRRRTSPSTSVTVG